jgi:hypothetical protein
MKTNAIAASAIVALLMLGGATVVFAHTGIGLGAGSSSSQSTQTTHTTTTTTGEHDHDNEAEDQNQQGQNHQEDDHDEGGHFNLTVGTTLTFSNLNGHWVAFTASSGHSDDSEDHDFAMKVGNSTGAFTFTVAKGSGDDFNLTITSGHFTINGTTYTVSGGKLTLNEGGEVGRGTGTASGGATFEIRVDGIHGNTTSSAQVGAIRLDVTVGKSTYLVILGSNEGVGEHIGED